MHLFHSEGNNAQVVQAFFETRPLERFSASVNKTSSILCIGLDPPIQPTAHESKPKRKGVRPLISAPLNAIKGSTPEKEVRRHIRNIIRTTATHAAAYKINLAFYLARGAKGVDLMHRIREWTAGTPLILDGKFNDIENTMDGYAAFSASVGVDAVTVSPYMGCDFSSFIKRGIPVFVLATTTNKPDIQSIQVATDAGTLARHVALKVSAHPQDHGLVVGGDAGLIRELCPESWFLSPGLGAQGRRPEDILKGLRRDGHGLLVNASRSIWSSPNPEEAAREIRQSIKVESAATF